MTADDELQAAADRGELGRRGNEAIRKSLDQSERRWIVMQVKEVAIAHDMDADQFAQMCEAIYKFITPPPAAPA